MAKKREDRNSDNTHFQREPDHRCCFERFGERCTLPGTLSPAAYTTADDGQGKRFFCRPHYLLLEHRITEAECAGLIRKARPTHWRDEAIDDYIEAHQHDPSMVTAPEQEMIPTMEVTL